jgi:uncharacterized membrane protein YhhN
MTKNSPIIAPSRAGKREEHKGLFEGLFAAFFAVPLSLRFVWLCGVCVAPAELWSEWTGARALHLATKPLIMMSVGAYFLLSTRDSMLSAVQKATRLRIIAGVVFSWLGDVALMFTEAASWVLLLGMGSFALAHLFYILAFRAGSGAHTLRKQAQDHYFFALALLIYGVLLYAALAPLVATDMKIPIAGYAVILLSMAFAAFVRRTYAAPGSFWLTFGGALAFVGSDSILAWHLFVKSSPALAVALMTLYISAQWAIALGMSKEVSRACAAKLGLIA